MMMAAPSFLSFLLMMLAGGAGNDLLDYVPTDAYFKAAKVEMTVPALTALLEAAEPDGPTRFGDSARRQMALRALGELGDVEALPAIVKLMGNENALLADYARAARAAIEGKDYQRESVSQDDLRGDLACLPSGVGVIGRMKMESGGPVDIAKQLAAAGMPGGEEKGDIEAKILQGLGGVIAQLGNLRIGALTFGVAGEIGPDAGYVVALARGLYDHEALGAMLGDRIGGVRRKAGGLVYHELESDHVYVAPVSDELLVFIAGASKDVLPLAEVGGKVVAGGGNFAISKTLAKMLDKADKDAPLWVLAEVTEAYKEAPFLKPFDAMALQGVEVGGEMKMSLTADGTDPDAVAEVVAELNKGLEKIRKDIAEAGDEMPGADLMKKVLKSTVIAASGASATFETKLPGGGGAVAMLPMLFFGAMAPMEAVPPDLQEAQELEIEPDEGEAEAEADPEPAEAVEE